MNKQQNSPLAKSKPGSTGPEPPVPQASPGPPGPLSQTPPMQRPVEPQEGPHKVSLSLFLSSHTDTGGGGPRVYTHVHMPRARGHRPQDMRAETGTRLSLCLTCSPAPGAPFDG